MPRAARAEQRPDRQSNRICVGSNEPPANYCVGNQEEKGLRRRGSDAHAVVVSLFLKGGLEFDASPSISNTVEDLDSPQHDDDGQYQRSRRQYTF